MFWGAGASVLAKPSFRDYLVSPIGFITIRSFTLELNKIGLFVSRSFVFYMYKSTAESVDGFNTADMPNSL